MPSRLAPLHEICHALGGYVCPLYAMENGRARLVGSGVPMRIEAAAFIVTAAHVAEQFNSRSLVTLGRDELLEVTGRRIGYRYIRNERVDTDLAVIELHQREAQDMSRRFSFSTLRDVADLGAADDKYVLYSLVGYPFSRNKSKPKSFHQLQARPTYVTTSRRVKLPLMSSEGKDERVHFAMWADANSILDSEDRPLTLPKPQGMSGGGVWRIDVDAVSGNLGLPKLVGIGIEKPIGDAFVATRVSYILPLLHDLSTERAVTGT